MREYVAEAGEIFGDVVVEFAVKVYCYGAGQKKSSHEFALPASSWADLCEAGFDDYHTLAHDARIVIARNKGVEAEKKVDRIFVCYHNKSIQ